MAKNKSLKLIFIGTPEFGAIILEGLIKNNYKPVLVVTGLDKPVGRKQILTSSEVKVPAKKYNILLFQPKKIKETELKIKKLKPDLIITAAYGQVLPKEILEIPKHGCLNIHPSLLPKYRGASPIQTAILNGDEKTGITIYLMDKKIDHGPIIFSIKFKIPDNDNYQIISQKLAELSVKLLIKTIPKWINGGVKPKPQNESKATYTKIIKKEDGKINWNKSAQEIERQIKAFYPWPGSFTFIKKNNILRVKILKANVSKKPKGLFVKCKKDYLIIDNLQLEGKKPITGQEFLRGYKNFAVIK